MKNYKIAELVSIAAVTLILLVTTFLIFYYAPWRENEGKRIIFLTGVAKNGVWTQESVNGSNYWTKDFRQAVIILNSQESVIFRFTSMDVTHTFYAPDLGIGPVEVWPGMVYDVPFQSGKEGSFLYYCTKVCGEKHYYMKGKIIILPENQVLTEGQKSKMLTDSIINNEVVEEIPLNPGTLVEKGKFLFTKKSCNTCHGRDGVGGVTNTNYALPTIPALNTMAQKLKIPDPESSELVLKLLEQKTDLDSLADNPPFNTYSRFLAQYKSIKQKIYDGSPVVQKLDTAGPAPPLTMPSWKHNLSEEEINSIIGFLISLNNWEDEL